MITHPFLWWDADNTRLSGHAYRACVDPRNDLFLSLVSIWEIQIKVQLGELVMRFPSLRDVLVSHGRDGLLFVVPSEEDVLGLTALPMIHRDPFDRLLISQALGGGFQFVSRDPLVAG